MPHKTRKEKLLADKRRKSNIPLHSSLLVKSQNQTIQKNLSSPPLSQFVFASQSVPTQKDRKSASESTAIRRDIIKITIFTGFAAVILLVLYFVLR